MYFLLLPLKIHSTPLWVLIWVFFFSKDSFGVTLCYLRLQTFYTLYFKQFKIFKQNILLKVFVDLYWLVVHWSYVYLYACCSRWWRCVVRTRILAGDGCSTCFIFLSDFLHISSQVWRYATSCRPIRLLLTCILKNSVYTLVQFYRFILWTWLLLVLWGRSVTVFGRICCFSKLSKTAVWYSKYLLPVLIVYFVN